MEIETLKEMFPSRSEQILAERVLETLARCSNLDVFQISERLSPNKSASARMAECHGLERILKDLQVLRIVTCKQDNYSLGEKGDDALDLLYAFCKPKRKTSQIDPRKQKYISFLCVNCGEIVSTRGTVKSAACTYCGHKNNLDETAEIILRTDDLAKLHSKIKQMKIRRAGGKRINPDLSKLKPQSIGILPKKGQINAN